MNTELLRIDRDLGGPQLPPANAAAFEQAWAAFSERFDPAASEGPERIQELARLLQVTSDNLDTVQNQKWFQRAWGTVSGGNKRLAKANEQNLLQVQKGAFFFLEGLAAQNQLMMQSVYYALQRVEDNQIQNERLKGHLLQVVRRYNDRIGGIEARQEELERRMAAHEAARGGYSWILPVAVTTCGLALLLLGAAVYGEVLPAQYYPEWWEGAWDASVSRALGFTGLALAVFGGVSLVRRLIPGQTGVLSLRSEAGAAGDVAAENARRRPTLRGELAEVLGERYAQHVTLKLAEPIWEAVEALDGPFEALGEHSSAQERAKAIRSFLAVSGDLSDVLRTVARTAAGEVREDFNELVAKVVDDHLGGDVGAKLGAELERSHQSALSHDIVETLEVYEAMMERIERDRFSLLARLERWESVATEGLAYGLGKAFVKGLLIVPALVDDEDEFMEAFSADYDKLVVQWQGFRDALAASFDSRLAEALRPFTRSAMQRVDALFDACDHAGVRLEDAEVTMAAYLFPPDHSEA